MKRSSQQPFTSTLKGLRKSSTTLRIDTYLVTVRSYITSSITLAHILIISFLILWNWLEIHYVAGYTGHWKTLWSDYVDRTTKGDKRENLTFRVKSIFGIVLSSSLGPCKFFFWIPKIVQVTLPRLLFWQWGPRKELTSLLRFDVIS